MVLIGWATQTRMDRQWQLLARLSGHFLDVVAGLPTLKVFGRAKAQAESIRAITADHRRATMRTLRITFLSSFALELLSTISVALVAVGVGMRLVHGELDLYTGLVILVLAPEAYLPLRQVGAQYHAAAEGLAAADEVFAVLETAPPRRGTAQAPDLRTAVVALDEVAVEGRLGPVSLRVSPVRRSPSPAPAGSARARCSPYCSASPNRPRDGSWPTAPTSPPTTRPAGTGRSPGCPSGRTCSPGPSPTTYG